MFTFCRHNQRDGVTCIPVLLAILAACACVAAPNSIDGVPGQEGQDEEALLGAVLDESKPYLDRWNALQKVRELPPEAKTPLLLSVIRNADDQVAMAAAFTAIRDGIHTPAVIEAARVRVSKWTLPYGPAIVQGIVHEGLGDAASAQAVLPLLRDVLRRTTEQRPPSDPGLRESVVIGVNWSAFAFVPFGQPADGKLFRDALRVYPEAYLGWLAAYKLGAMDAEMEALARRVYTDDGRNIIVRVAVALAMQDVDKQARSFVLTSVRAYLLEFGTLSMRELFPDTDNIYDADTQTRIRFLRIARERVLIALAAILKGDRARELLLSHLDSPNEVVGEFVRLVAARRWPEQVRARLATIPNDARAKTLATLELLHPSLGLGAPPAGLTRDDWNRIKDQVQRNLSRPQAEDGRLAIVSW